MDRQELYHILDIESPEEFTFYENLAALLEEERSIDVLLLEELFREIPEETMAELLGSYFEEFQRHIPEEQTDLYVTVETIRNQILAQPDAASLADEIDRFRRWYVIDELAEDCRTGMPVSVMNARYDIAAGRLTGEEAEYDFTGAITYQADGYDMPFHKLIREGL